MWAEDHVLLSNMLRSIQTTRAKEEGKEMKTMEKMTEPPTVQDDGKDAVVEDSYGRVWDRLWTVCRHFSVWGLKFAFSLAGEQRVNEEDLSSQESRYAECILEQNKRRYKEKLFQFV
ncbi:hypothetical protein TcYC6_0126800 [Trypanosoma cruzi]|nr:hypothetical protein TcYC6_0126800 [Trypanosoma cruzi]